MAVIRQAFMRNYVPCFCTYFSLFTASSFTLFHSVHISFPLFYNFLSFSPFSLNSLLFFIFLPFSSNSLYLSLFLTYTCIFPSSLSTSLFTSFFLLFSLLSLILFTFSFPLCSLPVHIYILPTSYAHTQLKGRLVGCITTVHGRW